MNLTQELSARYEHHRQRAVGGLSAVEHAANALLDAAGQTEPARARRAVHVAMYAERIGQAMGGGASRRLWLLGLLSVLESNTLKYGAFAGCGVDEEAAKILAVAQAFEDAVEAFGRDAGTSPAAAVRWMFSQRERFDYHAVSALRRALSGRRDIGEVEGAAAKDCAL